MRARPYHHGDLRAALLKAAERILERDGIQALALGGGGPAAGGAHAAPNNHFNDLTGLLSELAALGFTRFATALAVAMQAAGDDLPERMTAMGRAYVGFARAHPNLFALMFRSERLDGTRPALRQAVDAARQTLRAATLARAASQSLSPLQHAAQAVAHWSLVHGFAMLLLEGRLDGTLQALPGTPDADTLLDAVLASARVGD
jgi:AcrR family transcriptional regulator